MSQAFFVTGTDTEVGKTFITCALMQSLRDMKKTVIGYKPIAAGAELSHHGLLNEDALLLQQHGSFDLPYEAINPIVFAPPIAPHIAAQQAGQVISMARVDAGFQQLKTQGADIVLVEGAGGWRLPLGDGQYLSDWVADKQLPVILVVGMKLGCLNHAILTAESIIACGLKIAGWVANSPASEQAYLTANIDYLRQHIDAPYFGHMPFMPQADALEAAQCLDVAAML
ncbi:dethiobiotin synthase [Motilimonas sp. 1_MG-2023]|uniref:ATP-dependent dethiobiotin synthetase BioD n=1 Tax=Motilimonas cestriensis TaxID=2742685 RepID=A0ABS8WB05_9GAMM|nr:MULTISPECIES: dethiobiotin synthase [Motilimonas]MCE2595455.1 dethiobiotin synthase [Motilimonas cestriensis]MDO6526559.1 dethiobiotin synthase [Motilimonas sp. 1_MG-2023]